MSDMVNHPIAAFDPAVVDFVRETTAGDAYTDFFRHTLTELSSLAPAQRGDWLERQISEVCAGVISERIGNDLYVTLPGSTTEPGVVLRAYTDAFSQIALILAQMKLFSAVGAKFGPAKNACAYQFVTARANRDAGYADSPVILFQPTHFNVCTGHVGVVHYRCRLSVGRNKSITAVELFPFVVLSLESEARRLRRETNSPGFEAAHVYSNHGILGCYGQDPAAVCDRVSIQLTTHTNANPERIAMKLTQFLEEASAEYVARYAPNRSSLDAGHFKITILPCAETQNFRVDVFGQEGHPAIQTDSAITKAALLFGGLLKIAGNFQGFLAYGRLADHQNEDKGLRAGLPGVFEDDQSIILHGLQTFSPTHRVKDVQARMTEAATDAMKKYCRLRSRKFDAGMIEMSFEAPSCEATIPAENAASKSLHSAAAALGHSLEDSPIWPAWCDTKPSAIFGPGKLDAGANVADLQKALAVAVLATRTLTAK